MTESLLKSISEAVNFIFSLKILTNIIESKLLFKIKLEDKLLNP